MGESQSRQWDDLGFFKKSVGPTLPHRARHGDEDCAKDAKD